MIIGATVVIIGIAGAALATGNRQEPLSTHGKNATTLNNNSTTPTTKSSTATVAVPSPTTKAVAPTATTAPSTTTATPAPAYGEDPSNPGVFIVFDPTALMTEAGVDDQTSANTLITYISRWTYKRSDNSLNLCNVSPAAKMESVGTDYLDNPITQLKWCDQYAHSRYGSWAAALTRYNSSGVF